MVETISLFMQITLWILFSMEIIHVLAHSIVLTRVRLAPKKVLVKNRTYFILDLTSALVTALILRHSTEYMGFVFIHSLLHLYYVFTWNKSFYTKKIISWSSLEWKSKLYDVESIVLTLYDISVHVINAYLLYEFIGST